METMMKVCNDSKVANNANASIEVNTNVYGAFKPFAFLMKTPNWAKDQNCGQFNGYIAMDYDAVVAKGLYGVREEYDEEYNETEFINVNDIPYINEVTFDTVCKLSEIGPMCPLTAIPQEAIDCERVFVMGFDTCHIWNSWDKDDYNQVKKDTLEWLDKVINFLADTETN